MAELPCTPGQTVGPFLHLGLPCAGELADGPDAVRLHGTVYDGDGAPIPDALVELWQAQARWGRAATDPDGHYRFTTVVPENPPFFAITVFARGLLDRLFTRAYLPGVDPDADPVLGTVDVDRRPTMLCVAEGRADHRFDIHLQGPRETVFLAYRRAGG
ncbi:carboxypeptidase regulatory-like domain-containing protein [Mycobacterium genavense]|uniref:carboxypeptidase regulatory-like domain-containing protein n=1 Tax=Mycobacterium genavense TaxID=36812 RepID=UPI000688C1FC|nr:carboxypeptidase regulatory-like domain-containing protein [Mycobacterium genavense]